jgi:hypothetical protein
MSSAEHLNVEQHVIHFATTGLYLAIVYVWSVSRIISFNISVYTVTPSA